MKVFLKPKSGLLKRNPYFLDLWYGFKKTVKKLNIHHYDDFLKWKFDHVDHGHSNTVVVWFWYLPDFFVLSTGFTLNNFFFRETCWWFQDFFFFLGKILKQYLLKLDAIHGQKFGLQWLMNNFKGNALIFFFILLTVFNETRTKKWWYSHVTLEIRTWKPVVVFIETQVFLVKLRPSASTPPKKTWFQWNHHRFQVLTPK